MKVCHAANYLPNHHKLWGGAEQAGYRLARLSFSRGQKLAFLTTTADNQINEELDVHTIKTTEDYLFGNKKLIRMSRAFKRISFLPFDIITYFDSKRLLKKLKPDVLHLHNFNILTFAIIQSAKELGIPVVFSVYDNWCVCPWTTLIKRYGYEQKWEICRNFSGLSCLKCKFEIPLIQKLFAVIRRPFFDFFLRQIDSFIAINHNSAEMLVEYGIPKEKISVIPLPLLIPDKQNKQLAKMQAKDEPTILYVGWLEDRKGPHIAVKAMRDIVKTFPTARLYLAGPETDKTSYRNYLTALVRKEKMGDNIFFLGKKSNEEVLELMLKANVVIIPEQWEIAIPIALTEAMLLEKATVSSRIGGIPSFIDDGKNGFLADPQNPADFAKKIVWLLQNPAESKQFGKLARKKVLEICDESKINAKLAELYSSLTIQSASIAQSQ